MVIYKCLVQLPLRPSPSAATAPGAGHRRSASRACPAPSPVRVGPSGRCGQTERQASSRIRLSALPAAFIMPSSRPTWQASNGTFCSRLIRAPLASRGPRHRTDPPRCDAAGDCTSRQRLSSPGAWHEALVFSSSCGLSMAPWALCPSRLFQEAIDRPRSSLCRRSDRLVTPSGRSFGLHNARHMLGAQPYDYDHDRHIHQQDNRRENDESRPIKEPWRAGHVAVR